MLMVILKQCLQLESTHRKQVQKLYNSLSQPECVKNEKVGLVKDAKTSHETPILHSVI